MNLKDVIQQSVIELHSLQERDYTTYIPLSKEYKQIERKLPLVEVSKGLLIASNASVILGDVEFSKHVGKILARIIRRKVGNVHTLITAEAKAIGTAYKIAEYLKIKKIVIARKSVKSYMKNPIVVETRSITTKGKQILVIDGRESEWIKGRKIVLFDDVISTGGTLKSLQRLAEKLQVKVAGIATVWLEGPWPWDVFESEIKGGKLIWLSILPVFVYGKVAKELLEYRSMVSEKYG